MACTAISSLPVPYQAGPTIVGDLRGLGYDVFLDLKFHDIPHQVRGAAEAASRLGVQLLTVHAFGGRDMIEAAVEGAAAGAEHAEVPAPKVLAVTVLTSLSDDDIAEIGVGRSAAEQVALLAGLARSAGADGVVCSPQETRAMRALLGEDALVVTPGVRPTWAAPGDQSRIATPADALAAGASHLVVGRPILAAIDPSEAAERVLGEMQEVLG